MGPDEPPAICDRGTNCRGNILCATAQKGNVPAADRASIIQKNRPRREIVPGADAPDDAAGTAPADTKVSVNTFV
jgi:hypothetical protein